MKPLLLATPLAVALLLASSPAMSQAAAAAVTTAAPELRLDAQARSLVDNDLMTVVMAVEVEGARVQDLSQRVLATLQRAAARARALPGVEVRVGAINTQPVWGPKGRTGQWQVRGELGLSSTDVAGLGLLASELTADLQIASVGFSLSRAKSDEIEARLMTQAAEAFRRKAQAMASALGFKGYAIKTATLTQAGNAPPPRPVPMLRNAAASAEAGVPIPAEGGKTEVVLTMSGAVELR